MIDKFDKEDLNPEAIGSLYDEIHRGFVIALDNTADFLCRPEYYNMKYMHASPVNMR